MEISRTKCLEAPSHSSTPSDACGSSLKLGNTVAGSSTWQAVQVLYGGAEGPPGSCTGTCTVCRITAFEALFGGLGQLFYVLSGVQVPQLE